MVVPKTIAPTVILFVLAAVCISGGCAVFSDSYKRPNYRKISHIAIMYEMESVSDRNGYAVGRALQDRLRKMGVKSSLHVLDPQSLRDPVEWRKNVFRETSQARLELKVVRNRHQHIHLNSREPLENLDRYMVEISARLLVEGSGPEWQMKFESMSLFGAAGGLNSGERIAKKIVKRLKSDGIINPLSKTKRNPKE